MRRFDLSKVLFYGVVGVVAFGLVFGYGLYAGAKRTPVFLATFGAAKSIADSLVLVMTETPTLTGVRPTHFLQPARHVGEGVVVNEVAGGEDELILLSGFFEDSNELRLIRRDGSIVRRWPVRFSELFPDTSHLEILPATDWNIETHGALAMPDGSVVFNFEYGGLVKLDRCGEVAWTLRRQTHHSVERAEGGGFWVPGRRYHPAGSPSPFPPFTTPYYEDTVLKVSDAGEVLSEISVPRLLYENGLETLLTANGEPLWVDNVWDNEIVHLNKIGELTSDIAPDFPDFAAGDLALSLRTYNMTLVFDPDSRKIKWRRIGPWRRQHDPEFKAGGTIVLFNNNLYVDVFRDNRFHSDLDIPPVSNVIEVDPATDETRVIYGERRGQELVSVVRGKLELTPRGGLLITEYEAGRVLETDAGGRTIWSYVNRYSADEVAEITEARLYDKSYFDVADWSCGQKVAEKPLGG